MPMPPPTTARPEPIAAMPFTRFGTTTVGALPPWAIADAAPNSARVPAASRTDLNLIMSLKPFVSARVSRLRRGRAGRLGGPLFTHATRARGRWQGRARAHGRARHGDPSGR